MLYTNLKKDFLISRKNKDSNRKIYSSLLSDINTEIKNNPLEDKDKISLQYLTKYIKTVRDNIKLRDTQEFKDELSLYLSYMPRQLSFSELSDIISKLKKENNSFGFIMQSLKRLYDGRYNPQEAAKIMKGEK